MEELLKRHIEETDRRFECMSVQLDKISDRLEDIHTFKVEMIYTARMVSLIVSSLCGFVTLIATGVITYLLTYRIK